MLVMQCCITDMATATTGKRELKTENKDLKVDDRDHEVE